MSMDMKKRHTTVQVSLSPTERGRTAGPLFFSFDESVSIKSQVPSFFSAAGTTVDEDDEEFFGELSRMRSVPAPISSGGGLVETAADYQIRGARPAHSKFIARTQTTPLPRVKGKSLEVGSSASAHAREHTRQRTLFDAVGGIAEHLGLSLSLSLFSIWSTEKEKHFTQPS